MKIEILGTGCTKCKALEEAVKKAVAQIGGFHEVKKVEDIVHIYPNISNKLFDEKDKMLITDPDILKYKLTEEHHHMLLQIIDKI